MTLPSALVGYLRPHGRPVFAPAGPLLIWGGPGTGKTVLAVRLAQAAVESGGQCWAAAHRSDVPAYTGIASYVTTPDRITGMLTAAGDVAEIRAALPSTSTGGPSTAEPLVLVVDGLGDVAQAGVAGGLCQLASSDVGIDVVATVTAIPRRVPTALFALFPSHIHLTAPGVGVLATPGGAIGPIDVLPALRGQR